MKTLFASLNKFERNGLLISSMAIIALLVFWFFYKPLPYLAIPLTEISEEKLNITIRGDTAYIVAKLPSDYFSENTENFTPQTASFNRLSARKGDFEYRVFSTDANYNLVLLPYEKYRYQSISCQNLILINTRFLHRGRYVNGGIKCDEASDRWKRENLVYNLSGKSQSEFIANLYTPRFNIVEQELRIDR